jgi:hypothetical protein
VNLAACMAICVALWIVWSVPFVAAQSSWQAEWEKTLRAAEAEGQFALYGCCYDYDRVLDVFRKRYPKIKANIVVAVAGNSLACPSRGSDQRNVLIQWQKIAYIAFSGGLAPSF